MEENIVLLTLDYEKYAVNKFIYNDPICLGTSLKDIRKSLKKCNIDECYSLLKELGKEYYKNSDEKIEISSHIDNLIFNNIEYSGNDSIIELFSKNFDTNLYTNISFTTNDLLISWLNKYGVQSVIFNVYNDIKKLDDIDINNIETENLKYLIKYKNKYEFEILPIINLALSIYFITLINSTLNSLINSKNKSYSYNKLDDLLAPFPSLYQYYQENCIVEQEIFKDYKDETDTRYFYQFDGKFINILTNYLLKLYVIIKTYLDMIELPPRENKITHTMPIIPNKLSNYKNTNFIKQKEIYHNILQICCYKLSDKVINFLPKCIKCGEPIIYNKYLCPKHLIEYGEHKIQTYKGKKIEDMKKIKTEMEHLKIDNSHSVPTTIKYCSKDLADKKYDLKRRK